MLIVYVPDDTFAPVSYFFFELYGDHRDLHVLTHSFPTRRSSDLASHPAPPSLTFASALSLLENSLLALCLPACAQSQPSRLSPRASFRSEEHTSELQSLMRISYAVFCLKKKKKKKQHTTNKSTN